jgi:hypothetical protein
MKIFLTLSLSLIGLIFSSEVQAVDKEQCISQLTDHYYVTSKSITVNTDHYNVRDYENDHQAFSILMVRLALKQEGCHRDAVNFGRGPQGRSNHSCKMLIPGREYSRVCYIETNLGAFIVTTDFQTLVHVTYKHWD